METNEILAQGISTAILAIGGALGAQINSMLNKRKDEIKNKTAFNEKLKVVYEKLDMPYVPGNSWDYLFKRLREVENKLPAKKPKK